MKTNLTKSVLKPILTALSLKVLSFCACSTDDFILPKAGQGSGLGSKAQGKFQARTEDHSSEVPEPNFAKAVQKAWWSSKHEFIKKSLSLSKKAQCYIQSFQGSSKNIWIPQAKPKLILNDLCCLKARGSISFQLESCHFHFRFWAHCTEEWHVGVPEACQGRGRGRGPLSDQGWWERWRRGLNPRG